MSLNFKQILSESLMTTREYIHMTVNNRVIEDYNELENTPIKMIFDDDITTFTTEQILADFEHTKEEYQWDCYSYVNMDLPSAYIEGGSSFYVSTDFVAMNASVDAKSLSMSPEQDHYDIFDKYRMRLERRPNVSMHYIVPVYPDTMGYDYEFFYGDLQNSIQVLVFPEAEAVPVYDDYGFEYQVAITRNESKMVVLLHYDPYNNNTPLEYLPNCLSDITVSMKSVEKRLDNAFLDPNVNITNSLTIGNPLDGSSYMPPGLYTLSLGYDSIAGAESSCAIGRYCRTLERGSFAQGEDTMARGFGSHAEGIGTVTVGNYSHAEGGYSEAYGWCSHAEGNGTLALDSCQHVQGKYNLEDNSTYAHIVGNGTNNDNRSNAHTLDWKGNAWFAGNITLGENNYAVLTTNDVKVITTDDLIEIIGDIDGPTDIPK